MQVSCATLLSLLAIPAMDLLLAVRLATRIGSGAAWAWLGGTVVAGWILLRSGLARRADLGPAEVGALLARRAAGALLLWPGPVTDLLAVALLVPRARRWLLSRLLPPGFSGPPGGPGRGRPPEDPLAEEAGPGPDRRDTTPRGPVRDAEFEMVEDDTPPGPPR